MRVNRAGNPSHSASECASSIEQDVITIAGLDSSDALAQQCLDASIMAAWRALMKYRHDALSRLPDPSPHELACQATVELQEQWKVVP
jgi:hypothetical protein